MSTLDQFNSLLKPNAPYSGPAISLTSVADMGDFEAQVTLWAHKLAANLDESLMPSAERIRDSAKSKSPIGSGALRDSIEIKEVTNADGKAGISIGSELPYSRRIERGFIGTDSKGRTYHQMARPYLRPAFDEEMSDIQDKVLTRLLEMSIQQAKARR